MMKCKVLLDIDHTIYDYNKTHRRAMDVVGEKFKTDFQVHEEDFVHLYQQARNQVHVSLAETAAAHHRLLYFQTLFENMGINSLKYAYEYYRLYWSTFIENISLEDGVVEFLENYEGNLCFVTDLTADVQFQKVLKLGLWKYVSLMVSSEEVGKEKPHPYIYLRALQKLNSTSAQAVMIGDSFNKDIQGALMQGIRSIWINRDRESRSYPAEMVIEVHRFSDIGNFL